MDHRGNPNVFATPPRGMPVPGREGLGMSAPPERPTGPSTRTANASRSPRRKLSPGLSPKAKRPAVYVQPAVQPVTTMNAEELTRELATVRQAVQNMHEWVKTIYESVEDHADTLDTTTKDFMYQKGQLAKFERQITVGQASAEQGIENVFKKVDEILGEVKNETNKAVQDLDTRLETMAAAVQANDRVIREVAARYESSTASGSGGSQPPQQNDHITAQIMHINSVIDDIGNRMGQAGQENAARRQEAVDIKNELMTMNGRMVAIEKMQQSRDPWARGPGGPSANPTAGQGQHQSGTKQSGEGNGGNEFGGQGAGPKPNEFGGQGAGPKSNDFGDFGAGTRTFHMGTPKRPERERAPYDPR